MTTSDKSAPRCYSDGCDRLATHEVFWPGGEPRLMCPGHHKQAINIAQAMGFYLHTRLHGGEYESTKP